MDLGEEEVDWVAIGIAATVELEEAETEAATVEEARLEDAVTSAARSTKRKVIPPSFNLADVDTNSGTCKKIEEYATPEIRDE
ncbi:hypothetical protein ZWY2020_058843 [Hordeum vulgare]|nr:hypothetical protein ZWY2020_058843 [Hordeum vulgare]